IVLMAGVTLILTIEDRDGEARLQGNDRTHLPSSDNGVDETAVIQKGLALAERQFIKERRHKALVSAKARGCAITGDAKLILRELLVAGRHADPAASIDRFRPGVAHQIRKPRAETPLKLRRQRVVLGLAESRDLEHPAYFRP